MRALLLLTLLIATPALALPVCDPVQSCTDAGVYYGKQTWELQKLGSKWARKHCSCELRGGAPTVPRGSSTVVIADPTAPARDARGKLGPTPAPREPTPTPLAENLADDGPFASDLAVAAQRYKLPVHLLRAVMQVESGGNPLAVSNKGAIGLMQLMPETAKGLGVDDPHDTAQNILGGARFLRILANRFEGDLVKVLSAYHAGSLRVQGRDATPFAATDDYVRKILRLYYQLRDTGARRG